MGQNLEKPGILVNPILFLIIAGLTVLFIAALLYQVLGKR